MFGRMVGFLHVVLEERMRANATKQFSDVVLLLAVWRNVRMLS
jgi:hypothetical protein